MSFGEKLTNVFCVHFFFSANGLSCYSASKLDHTGIAKDKYVDHSTTVNGTKTLSNGNGDIDGVCHRTLSDVEVSKLKIFYDSTTKLLDYKLKLPHLYEII